MILWIGNDAVLKSSSLWQLNEFWKLNNFGHEFFIYKILLIAIDWNFQELKERGPLKTWEEKKMLVTSIFFISHNVFYPSQNELQFFSNIYFVVCKCFQIGMVQNFVVW